MRRGVAVWMGCAILMLGVAGTEAKSGHELSEEQLRAEMARNRELAAYVKRNGMPDLAETRFLSDHPPWDDHEVTLFYLDEHREIAFARAYLLGRPEVQIQRYERTLSEEEVASLSSRLHGKRGAEASAESSAQDDTAAGTAADTVADTAAERDDDASASADRMLRPDERAENAARRAEAAADRVEVAAAATEHAAERTEAIVEKMAAAMTKKAPTKRAAKAKAAPAVAAPAAEAAPTAEAAPAAGPTASQ